MSFPLLLLFSFTGINLVGIIVYLFLKQHQKNLYRKELYIREMILQFVFTGAPFPPEKIKLLKKYFYASARQLASLFGTMVPDNHEKERIRQLFNEAGLTLRLKNFLNSPNPRRRYLGALSLRFLLPEDQRACLATRLSMEPYRHIRIALVKGLLDADQHICLNSLAESLGTDAEYDKIVASMVSISGYRFIGWAKENLATEDSRYKRLILFGARVHTTTWLSDFVTKALGDSDAVVRNAALACGETYPDIFNNAMTTAEQAPGVRKAAVLTMARRASELDIPAYIRYFSDKECFHAALGGLRDYLQRFPETISTLLDLLHTADSGDIRRGTALSLAGRLPYLLAARTPLEDIEVVVKTAAAEGYTSGLIGFLNSNRDTALFNRLKPVLSPLITEYPEFRRDIARFLDPALQKELGIRSEKKIRNVPRIPLERKDRVLLAGMVILIVSVPVAAMIAGYGHTAGEASLLSLARYGVRTFTAFYAWYAAILNTIYLLLLFAAVANLFRQTRYWNIQDHDFLFTPGVVPSIAVVAPAYNEEKTVVESVNSLLTLIYPDYQVIVVNDGSADETIEVLKREFQLVRIDKQPEGSLKTAPVKGIYYSPANRRLLVIDKENGGKADALNCGINYAEKEYVCSIDSDSLLEPDSLLRMTTEAMTGKMETIAIGGNILPVNGCTVNHGTLQRIALGKNKYSRLQTIEYLRSFIAGRLGWAQLNSLLIISGAFGLFRRERVLEIGGYLTGRGEHKRDTVGEDMELVVRLIRHMGERKLPYRVRYAATANCWTEVPEDLDSIYKQRDRWHRGLAEVMTFHRKLLFNPRFGTAGLIGLPYFLFFEVIGPFYEFAGYLFMLIGFIAGIHSLPVFIVLFSVCILYGTLISLVSLILSEYGIVYFRRVEVLKLILTTFSENLGYRQLMGWVRVFSLAGMIFKNKGWQKLERKGFSADTADRVKKIPRP